MSAPVLSYLPRVEIRERIERDFVAEDIDAGYAVYSCRGSPECRLRFDSYYELRAHFNDRQHSTGFWTMEFR